MTETSDLDLCPLVLIDPLIFGVYLEIGNWLHDIDHRFRMHTRVEAIVVFGRYDYVKK
jgi:hypothetical protein